MARMDDYASLAAVVGRALDWALGAAACVALYAMMAAAELLCRAIGC